MASVADEVQTVQSAVCDAAAVHDAIAARGLEARPARARRDWCGAGPVNDVSGVQPPVNLQFDHLLPEPAWDRRRRQEDILFLETLPALILFPMPPMDLLVYSANHPERLGALCKLDHDGLVKG